MCITHSRHGMETLLRKVEAIRRLRAELRREVEERAVDLAAVILMRITAKIRQKVGADKLRKIIEEVRAVSPAELQVEDSVLSGRLSLRLVDPDIAEISVVAQIYREVGEEDSEDFAEELLIDDPGREVSMKLTVSPVSVKVSFNIEKLPDLGYFADITEVLSRQHTNIQTMLEFVRTVALTLFSELSLLKVDLQLNLPEEVVFEAELTYDMLFRNVLNKLREFEVKYQEAQQS